MSDQTEERGQTNRVQGTDIRRRQLRALLLSAADAARQSRRAITLALVRPDQDAVRDRISKLLSAAS